MIEPDFLENAMEGVDSQKVLEKALFNRVILHNIMSSFLCFNDWKNCRMVNKKWAAENATIVGLKCKEIKFVQFLFDNKPPPGTHEITDMPRLTQLIKANPNFPCKDFCLILEPHTSDTMPLNQKLLSAIYERMLAAFLQVAGPLITRLKILGCVFKESVYLFRNEESFPRNINFARLKKLELNIHESYDKRQKCIVISFISAIINVATRLNELMLEIYITDHQHVNLFLAGIDSPNVREIKRLTLHGTLQDAYLLRLQEMRVKLNYLNLAFLRDTQNIQPSVLTAFLETQKDSLKELVIDAFGCSVPLTVIFPEMQYLSHLEIINSQYFPDDPNFDGDNDDSEDEDILRFPEDFEEEDTLRFPELSYTRNFPALTRLQLNHNTTNWNKIDKLFNRNMRPLNTLKVLELPQWLDDPTVVRQAARIFPRLVKLVVPVRRELMGVVFNAMKVEELTLFLVYESRGCLEEILTGYSESQLRQIKGSSGQPKLIPEKKREPPKFLQGLKVLKVQESSGIFVGECIGITDFACRHILPKLTSLRCV